MGRVKGNLFIHLREHVAQARGQDAWRAMVANLTQADVAHWSELLLASAWYPVGTWNRTMDAFVHGRPNPAADVKQFGLYISQHDFHSMFRVLLRAATADLVLSRTDSIWTRYFDTGTLRPSKTADKRWQITIDAPNDEDAAPSRTTCMGVTGWVENALSLTGVTTSRVTEAHCRFKGAPRCTFDVVW